MQWCALRPGLADSYKPRLALPSATAAQSPLKTMPAKACAELHILSHTPAEIRCLTSSLAQRVLRALSLLSWCAGADFAIELQALCDTPRCAAAGGSP